MKIKMLSNWLMAGIVSSLGVSTFAFAVTVFDAGNKTVVGNGAAGVYYSCSNDAKVKAIEGAKSRATEDAESQCGSNVQRYSEWNIGTVCRVKDLVDVEFMTASASAKFECL